VYTLIEENLELNFCLHDQLPDYAVSKIDDMIVRDYSNQIVKAGLARMDLASTYQKPGAFITGAEDRYYEMNLDEKLVEIHIVISKILQDARPEGETYMKMFFYNATQKVYVVVCIAWELSFPKPPELSLDDVVSDEEEYEIPSFENGLEEEEDDNDNVPSIDEDNISQEKENNLVSDEEEYEIPSFENGLEEEKYDNDDIPSIDEDNISQEKENDPTQGCEKNAYSCRDADVILNTMFSSDEEEEDDKDIPSIVVDNILWGKENDISQECEKDAPSNVDAGDVWNTMFSSDEED
jgi:hypothetical protein